MKREEVPTFLKMSSTFNFKQTLKWNPSCRINIVESLDYSKLFSQEEFAIVHCCKHPIFVQKIKLSKIPFLAGKFKFNVWVDFIKIEFLNKNWYFASLCISRSRLKVSSVGSNKPLFSLTLTSNSSSSNCYSPITHELVGP